MVSWEKGRKNPKTGNGNENMTYEDIIYANPNHDKPFGLFYQHYY